MKSNILKEQLRPFYNGLLFLDLIFEEKKANEVRSMIKENVGRKKIKANLYQNNLIEEYKVLSYWMNWNVLTEGETYDPTDPRQADYGEQPEIDAPQEEETSPFVNTDQKYSEFPLYVIYENDIDGTHMINVFKADSQEELMDFVEQQSNILDQTPDPELAKRKFFSYGGKEENFQINTVKEEKKKNSKINGY